MEKLFAGYAARIIGVSRTEIGRMRKRGELTGERQPNGFWVYPLDQVKQIAAQRRQENYAKREGGTIYGDRTITTSEVAQYIGVTPARIRSLRLSGRIRGIQTSSGWTYEPSEVQRLVAMSRPAGRPARVTPP